MHELDDGGGIPFEELSLALTSHATSKLGAIEDLEAILTLGYRGEALASIGAVSELEIRSQPARGEGGFVRMSFGKPSEPVRSTGSQGTRIQVEELFQNLPARRKFLRNSAAELRRVALLVRDYALAWPQIGFSLSNDGKRLFTTEGEGDRARTLTQLWGREPAVKRADAVSGDLALECWWQPFPSRGRNEICSFVNGRSVADPLIKGAVAAVGKEYSGNWALFFSINPAKIDVNIHPAKAEIRFRVPGDVFDSLNKAAEQLAGIPEMPTNRFSDRDSLPERSGVPQPSPLLWREDSTRSSPFANPSFSSSFPSRQSAYPPGPSKDLDQLGDSLFGRMETSFPMEDELDSTPFDETPPEAEPARQTEDPESGTVVYMGQLYCGYLIFNVPTGIVIMDPHAAHERVAYERIRGRMKSVTSSQKLLTPEPLPPTLAVEVREYDERLRSLGFRFEEHSGGLAVTETPHAAEIVGPAVSVLRATLALWREEGETREAMEERLAGSWASLACKEAVKLTSRLEEEEAIALWRDVMGCQTPYSCPHGRPAFFHLSAGALAKHFGRT
jgi:DNA mismatch repair protein MutL